MFSAAMTGVMTCSMRSALILPMSSISAACCVEMTMVVTRRVCLPLVAHGDPGLAVGTQIGEGAVVTHGGPGARPAARQ